MQPTHIEHIGIAVKNLTASIKYYEDVLGLKCYAMEEVKDQKVRVAFCHVGDASVELTEATAPDSPIAKFIEKRGEGVHHLCFQVEDIRRKL